MSLCGYVCAIYMIILARCRCTLLNTCTYTLLAWGMYIRSLPCRVDHHRGLHPTRRLPAVWSGWHPNQKVSTSEAYPSFTMLHIWCKVFYQSGSGGLYLLSITTACGCYECSLLQSEIWWFMECACWWYRSIVLLHNQKRLSIRVITRAQRFALMANTDSP